MKKLSFILSALIISLVLFAFSEGEEYKTLEIGQKAPMTNYKMQSTKGEKASLDDFDKSNGTLVVFSCNTCPFVIAWEDRYPNINNLCNKSDIGFVLINSNEAKRGGDDSYDNMITHANDKGYSNIPYLVDKNSELANAFGAKTTPHVFLFDNNWNLVYEGAIDDNYKNAQEVKEHYLNNAIENLSLDKPIDPNNTKALGCSIKRVKS